MDDDIDDRPHNPAGTRRPDPEEAILRAWQGNAAAWTEAVRSGRIGTRHRVTDATILAAAGRHGGHRILDVGCGEGWLARRLTAAGYTVIGVDASPGLIASARAADGGDYRLVAYRDMAPALAGLQFDAMICNFSLLGEHSTAAVCASASRLLTPGGRLIIQTLHPDTAAVHSDGWRNGSWPAWASQCEPRFTHPAPWYARTFEGWQRLLAEQELELVVTDAPIDPATNAPASLLLVAMPANVQHVPGRNPCE